MGRQFGRTDSQSRTRPQRLQVRHKTQENLGTEWSAVSRTDLGTRGNEFESSKLHCH